LLIENLLIMLNYPRAIEYCANWNCNMTCSQCCCLSFACTNSDYISVDAVQIELEPWSQRIAPKKFCLLGGEPFIHPCFIELVKMLRVMWRNVPIVVGTNGMMLENCSENWMRTFKENDIEVYCAIKKSIRPFEQKSVYNINTVESGIKRWKNYGVTVRTNTKRQMYLWVFNRNNRIIPFHTDPVVSHRWCSGKSACPSHIYEGKLYACYRLAVWQKGIDAGILDPDIWGNRYEPASVTDADQKILKTLCVSSPFKVCGRCPTNIYYV